MAAHQNEAPPGRPLLESGPVGWLRHRRRKHPPRAGAPEAFADDRIDWETLREALGDYLDDDGAGAEHFGLFWPGKRQARRLASTPSKSTLIPVAGEGVNEETTKNVFIEGDNLEVAVGGVLAVDVLATEGKK